MSEARARNDLVERNVSWSLWRVPMLALVVGVSSRRRRGRSSGCGHSWRMAAAGPNRDIGAVGRIEKRRRERVAQGMRRLAKTAIVLDRVLVEGGDDEGRKLVEGARRLTENV